MPLHLNTSEEEVIERTEDYNIISTSIEIGNKILHIVYEKGYIENGVFIPKSLKNPFQIDISGIKFMQKATSMPLAGENLYAFLKRLLYETLAEETGKTGVVT